MPPQPANPHEPSDSAPAVPGADNLARRHERIAAAAAAARAAGAPFPADAQAFLDCWQLLDRFMEATSLTAPPDMSGESELAAGPPTEREVRSR